MQHECKITVLETKIFPDLQEKYLTDPKSGPCPFFKPGDTQLFQKLQTRNKREMVRSHIRAARLLAIGILFTTIRRSSTKKECGN